LPARLRVGLTGGLGSGKSTVAGWLAEAGFTVVDADELVAELYRPGAAGARAVEEVFGPGLLAADESVDKPALAGLVFHDPDARVLLEQAIHPLVRARFAEIAAAMDGGAIVFEATLLVEAGYASELDFLVTVEAPQELRIERAVRRGLDEPDARARVAAQSDGEARRSAADRILDNSGDLDDLRRATSALIAELSRAVAEPG